MSWLLSWNHFHHIKYSAIYCKIDCEVLEKGYNIFRQDTFKATKLEKAEKLGIKIIDEIELLKLIQ